MSAGRCELFRGRSRKKIDVGGRVHWRIPAKTRPSRTAPAGRAREATPARAHRHWKVREMTVYSKVYTVRVQEASGNRGAGE
jgi:hypothetical protein